MQLLNFDTLPDDHITKLGLIVLQSDVTIEDEFRFFFDGLPVSLMVSRIPFENEVTVETLKQMEGHISNSMSLFPIDAEFNCVGYGCTSGALHIGHAPIGALVNEARTTQAVTNPMLSAVTAMQHIDAKKIAYLAPYSQEVSQTMVDEFERNGIEVAVSATFNESQDRIVGRISPESIKQASIEITKQKEVDAVFVSCTNMKCAQIIPEIEAATGIVATSSNQVLAWHMAKLANIKFDSASSVLEKGRLLQC
jgi:maleate isomerase